MIRLIVEYDLPPGAELSSLDQQVHALAGRQSTDSGVFLPTQTRDMTFLFENSSDADAARERLLKAGYKTRTVIH